MNSRNRYPLAGFSSLVVCSFFAAGVNADSGLTSAIFVEQAAQAGMACRLRSRSEP